MILYKNSQKSEEIIKNIPEDLKSLVINIMHINMDLGKKIENKLSYINYGLMPKYRKYGKIRLYMILLLIIIWLIYGEWNIYAKK